MTTTRRLLVALLILMPAAAQAVTYDFNNFTPYATIGAPGYFSVTGIPYAPLKYFGAWGMIPMNDPAIAIDGVSLVAGSACTSCHSYWNYGYLVLSFSDTVGDVSFLLRNAYTKQRTFEVSYSGTGAFIPSNILNIAAWVEQKVTLAPGEVRRITLNAQNIRIVRIGDATVPTDFAYRFSIDDVEFNSGTPGYEVHMNISTDAGLPYELTKDIGGGTIEAEVPLGTFVAFKMIKKPAQPLDPMIPVYATYSEGDTTVTPFTVRGRHLHADKVLLPLTTMVAANTTKEYVAVHLGTTTVSLLPSIAGAPTTTVRLTVKEPVALGSRENTWDAVLTKYANERGILPQYLKGQVAQESNGRHFVERNYVYEPCTTDRGQISAGLINSTPYSYYALETARGITLVDETIAPRNQYSIATGYDANGVPTGRRALMTPDTDVTAKAIFDANNKWPPFGRSGANWSDHCAAASRFLAAGGSIYDFSTQELDFTAQTPTAASYGVFQVMYSTAIDQGWSVIDPMTNQRSWDPRFLFDTAANHLIDRGGSVEVGSNYDAENLGARNVFATREEFETYCMNGFQRYNRGLNGYGRRVVKLHAPTFLPLGPPRFN